MKYIKTYENISRGEYRKISNNLLDKLAVAYLNNIASDHTIEIKQALTDINNSNINWEKDVVNSVKEKYRMLTSPETIQKHMLLWKK